MPLPDGSEVSLRVLTKVESALLVVFVRWDTFAAGHHIGEILSNDGPYSMRVEVESFGCSVESGREVWLQVAVHLFSLPPVFNMSGTTKSQYI